MAIFENENEVLQDSSYRAHLNRNWDNGNKQFDAMNARINAKAENSAPDEVVQARIDADGNVYKSLAGRLDANQKVAENAKSVADDAVNYARNELYTKLAQIDNGVKGYQNVDEIKQAYPNGAEGIFVAIDTGHQWYYVNNSWVDAGSYQVPASEQAKQVASALTGTLKERVILPYDKKENYMYQKDNLVSTTSGYIYYYNIAGLSLLRVKTGVNPYFNFYTLLSKEGNVVSYQRNDSETASIDLTIVAPSGATTLVLGGFPGGYNQNSAVSTFDLGRIEGNFYQGNIKNTYIENGMSRASLVIDSKNYESLIYADDSYQVYDEHLGKWDSSVLIPQGSDVESVSIKRTDDAYFKVDELKGHVVLKKVYKDNLILKSYQNGLSDISDNFKLSYNTILENQEDHSLYMTNKYDKIGRRIALDFKDVAENQSWLIELDEGYEVEFITAQKSNDKYMKKILYNNQNVIKSVYIWLGNLAYQNLYAGYSYSAILKKSDNSLITINDFWNHVRIYKVDNSKHLPSYYREHIEQKVTEINEKLTDYGSSAFGFITDVHLEFNQKHFPALIKQILSKTSVTEFMGGGDWATSWFKSSTTEEQKVELFKSFEELRSLFEGIPLLKTVGNHEWAYGNENSKNITSKEMYGYYLRDQERYFKNLKWGADHTYYYWDNESTKMRYISLNVMDYPDVETPTGHADNKEWYFKVSDAQKNWFKEALKTVPEGYLVAVESHLVPLDANQFSSILANTIGTTIENGSELRAIISAYAKKEGDFAQAKGDLVAWFGGHYHQDDITVLDGVTYVTTLADCMSVAKATTQKVANTKDDQAFDVVIASRNPKKVDLIRIGSGNNRTFEF